MEVFFGLIFTVITLAILYLKYLEGYWRRRGIPHIKPEFPYGNIKEFRKTKHLVDISNEIYNRFRGTGPFAGYYFMLRPAVLALDLDFIKNVLIRDFSNFDDRGVFHNESSDPLTANLFSVDGEKWRGLRNKLSSTFTSGKMKLMFPTLLKVGDEFVRVLDEKVASTPKGILEVTDLVSRFTSDVIGSCAFGIECNSLRDPNAEFVVMGKRTFLGHTQTKLIDAFIESFPVLAGKLRMRQFHPDLNKFYTRIVSETIEYREKHNIQRNDFMQMLIDIKNKDVNGKGLTLTDIVGQSFVFLVAGFDTSATTMGFALYELAFHPEIQDRLREEVNEVFERHNKEFTYEGLAEMKYMQQVIAETLRKYPTLPHVMRKAKKRYETSDPKYFIEKGTSIVISLSAIHNDPEIYPDPEIFDPERFTDEAIKARHTCAYMPFGEGPRNCIGMRFGKMQAQLGLAVLIKNFKVSPCEQTKPLTMGVDNLLLNAKGGIYLNVEKV